MKHLTSIVLFLSSSSLFALEYEKDIMPFLAKKCGECHSKDGKAMGGLKLDDPKHFFSRFEKNRVVIPGDWDASYLFVTLFRPADHDDAMPPSGKGERLTVVETRMVQQWIADGAPIVGEKGEKGVMPKEGEAGYISGGDPETAADAMAKPLPAVEQDWINSEGRTMRATLLRVDGGKAVFKMKNGQVFKYAIENLSEESQAKLPK